MGTARQLAGSCGVLEPCQKASLAQYTPFGFRIYVLRDLEMRVIRTLWGAPKPTKSPPCSILDIVTIARVWRVLWDVTRCQYPPVSEGEKHHPSELPSQPAAERGSRGSLPSSLMG